MQNRSAELKTKDLMDPWLHLEQYGSRVISLASGFAVPLVEWPLPCP